MAEDTHEIGKRITFDATTLERAQDAAKERGMTLNRLIGLALTDFCDRLLPADEIVWTYRDVTIPKSEGVTVGEGFVVSDGGREVVEK